MAHQAMPTEMRLRPLAMLLVLLVLLTVPVPVLLVQQQAPLLLDLEQVVLAAASLPTVLGSASPKQLATIQTVASVLPFVRVAAPCFLGAAYQQPHDHLNSTHRHRPHT